MICHVVRYKTLIGPRWGYVENNEVHVLDVPCNTTLELIQEHRDLIRKSVSQKPVLWSALWKSWNYFRRSQIPVGYYVRVRITGSICASREWTRIRRNLICFL